MNRALKTLLASACAAATFATPALAKPGFFAVINSDGTLARGPGVVSSSYEAVSKEYFIQFSHGILHCSVTATLGDPGSSAMPGPGFIVAAVRRKTGGTYTLVRVFDTKGQPTARSFQVHVSC